MAWLSVLYRCSVGGQPTMALRLCFVHFRVFFFFRGQNIKKIAIPLLFHSKFPTEIVPSNC
jgi:hypothetical protein